MLVRQYIEERGADKESVSKALEELGQSVHPNSTIEDIAALDAALGISADTPGDDEPVDDVDDDNPDHEVSPDDPNIKRDRDRTPEAQVKPTTKVLGPKEPGMRKWKIEVSGKKSEVPVGVYHAWGFDETQAISRIPQAYKVKDMSKTRCKATPV